MGQLALPSKSVAESRATTAEVKRGEATSGTELDALLANLAQGKHTLHPTAVAGV